MKAKVLQIVSFQRKNPVFLAFFSRANLSFLMGRILMGRILMGLTLLGQSVLPVFAAGMMPPTGAAPYVTQPFPVYLPLRLVTGTAGFSVDVAYAPALDLDHQPVAQTTPASVALLLTPASLPADGRSEAQVLVFVSDAAGQPVEDGTSVTVKTEIGTLPVATGVTREGLVRLSLIAPAHPGAGRVTARAGDVADTVMVTAKQVTSTRLGNTAALSNAAPPMDPREAVQRVRHRLQPQGNGQWAVTNRRYAATFGTAEVAVSLQDDGVSGNAALRGTLAVHLLEIQHGATRLYPAPGYAGRAPQVQDNEARYERAPDVVEAYQARDVGVQHSFTFQEALPGEGDLVIRLHLNTSLRPVVLSAEQGVLFYPAAAPAKATSGAVLRYSGALVSDAEGREIYADLALQGRQLTLSVPAAWLADAAYPVVVDPVIGDPILVSDPRAMQGELDVAYNPDDDEYLVVWSGYDTGGASSDLQGQRVEGDGTVVGDLIVIAQAAEEQVLPAVAYNPDAGEYLVLWSDYRADVDGDVYGQRVAGDGSLVGSNFAVGAGFV